MKIIIENKTKVVTHVFEDNDLVVIEEDKVVTPHYQISGLHSGNATLIEGVSDAPNDLEGAKYFYNEGVWTANPAWQTATEAKITALEEELTTLKASL